MPSWGASPNLPGLATGVWCQGWGQGVGMWGGGNLLGPEPRGLALMPGRWGQNGIVGQPPSGCYRTGPCGKSPRLLWKKKGSLAGLYSYLRFALTAHHQAARWEGGRQLPPTLSDGGRRLNHRESDGSVSNTKNRGPRRGRMLCGASEHEGSRGGFEGQLGTQRLECVDLSYCVHCLPCIPSPNTRIQDVRCKGRKRWGKPKR